jgi:hypothetical protein
MPHQPKVYVLGVLTYERTGGKTCKIVTVANVLTIATILLRIFAQPFISVQVINKNVKKFVCILSGNKIINYNLKIIAKPMIDEDVFIVVRNTKVIVSTFFTKSGRY